jgi:hypothetical protein
MYIPFGFRAAGGRQEEPRMSNDKPQADRVRANDGTTLDIVIDETEALPHGLNRLRSGVIAVTKVFCPNGHNLISAESGARFNGFPGISVMVEGRSTKGIVILSPIHGDDTKFGESDFDPGEQVRLSCPQCDVTLPAVSPCGCTPESELIGLFLDEDRVVGNQVAICNVWGCLRSRIIDRFQIISKLD